MFLDRADAGKKLASVLKKRGYQDVIVYALPRGGVVVGAEIAKALHCPLDLVIVRKIGHQYQPEYAIGAISEHGEPVMSERDVGFVDKEWLHSAIKKEQEEIVRRKAAYVGGKNPAPATGKTAIVVDDGIATGLTMKAAIKEIHHQHPQKIVLAVPVAPKNIAEELQKEVDAFVSLHTPDDFLGAIGSYYESFPQVTDEEVKALLQQK